MTSVLLLGASGLVGAASLQVALHHDRVVRVVAPTRRTLPAHPKLMNPVSSSLESLLPEVADWATDSVICALGTTRKKAGSNDALRHVDYELPLSFARASQKTGATVFAVVTSIGASPTSSLFYARTKGELERDLQAVGFQSLTILRPMFIDGAHAEFRRGEAAVTLRSTYWRRLRRRFSGRIASGPMSSERWPSEVSVARRSTRRPLFAALPSTI
jgi:uncharacterized protein YbjT (DUF2867 family)